MSFRGKVIFHCCFFLAILAAVCFVRRIPQALSYHNFSDQRTILGVPNFADVVSNAPFLVVGAWGLALVIRRKTPGALPELRAAYAVFFASVALVAVGSGYYHLYRTNDTLLWDRLPMGAAFMAFLAALAGERISVRAGRRALWPLVALGAGSVLLWWGTDDLRAYYLVQGGALVLTPALLVLHRSKLTGDAYLWAVLGGYVAAKAAEVCDRPIYEFTGFISGHTLKHLLAAAGTAFFLAAITKRRMKETLTCA